MWIGKKDTKHVLECIIDIDKDHISKPQESISLSMDCRDSYDNKDSYIDEDNMLTLEEYKSDFEEWLKKSRKSWDKKKISSCI